ncbi:hypothetical protein H1R82_08215 [Thermoactinomyces intermedius]|jgi:hypothetical protein|uniref:Uncharacterized protein n=1 Tax=Thermoactinomyces intermedius TaxID=2024 RepID=A0A8I1A9U3_THEIN|nr:MULTISPECIES: hypothetical protein [Thermoactinomyces]MBA4547779.1 hypothetical protein [Thermoactinomyces intermedius]MBA4836610.1 hypothetical protein [Thermoactinomyces intermedius]MBH8593992.1 hypothetical protein [Thermoactinomyces intermedius]MBH8600040.1 hypothetical protein [Thermoactinomyces sp. CICC 23799]
MDPAKRNELRKKQRIYTNVLILVYLGILALLALAQLSSLVIYTLLGVLCFLVAISSFWLKTFHPTLLLFPGMKELIRYEKEKLGETWKKYHLSSVILAVVLGVFFLGQAWFRQDLYFLEGIPVWYIAVFIVGVFLIGNLSLFAHARRFDRLSEEQIRVHAAERSLFTVIFACVVLGMTLLGSVFILLIS